MFTTVTSTGNTTTIGFGGAVDPSSVMQNVRVEFAGGPGRRLGDRFRARHVGESDYIAARCSVRLNPVP